MTYVVFSDLIISPIVSYCLTRRLKQRNIPVSFRQGPVKCTSCTGSFVRCFSFSVQIWWILFDILPEHFPNQWWSLDLRFFSPSHDCLDQNFPEHLWNHKRQVLLKVLGIVHTGYYCLLGRHSMFIFTFRGLLLGLRLFLWRFVQFFHSVYEVVHFLEHARLFWFLCCLLFT